MSPEVKNRGISGLKNGHVSTKYFFEKEVAIVFVVFSKETGPADTVLLHGGYARCPNIVHPSPFVFKVELFMRINKIPYKVSVTIGGSLDSP